MINRTFRSRSLSLLFSLTVILAVLMSGCAAAVQITPGQVAALQPGSTAAGVLSTMNRELGTAVMTDPANRFYLFKWVNPNLGQTVQFFLYDAESGLPLKTADQIAPKGNIVAIPTWHELRDYLMQSNWRVLAPEAIPGTIRVVALRFASMYPSFLFVSGAGLLTPAQLEQYVHPTQIQ